MHDVSSLYFNGSNMKFFLAFWVRKYKKFKVLCFGDWDWKDCDDNTGLLQRVSKFLSSFDVFLIFETWPLCRVWSQILKQNSRLKKNGKIPKKKPFLKPGLCLSFQVRHLHSSSAWISSSLNQVPLVSRWNLTFIILKLHLTISLCNSWLHVLSSLWHCHCPASLRRQEGSPHEM